MRTPSISKTTPSKQYFSKATGREVSQGERIAAARARVAADKKRNVITEQWIIELAQKKPM